MAKRYTISFLRRPPFVILITNETALHWIDTDGNKHLKAACSTRTYSRKQEAEKDCKGYQKYLKLKNENYPSLD